MNGKHVNGESVYRSGLDEATIADNNLADETIIDPDDSSESSAAENSLDDETYADNDPCDDKTFADSDSLDDETCADEDPLDDKTRADDECSDETIADEIDGEGESSANVTGSRVTSSGVTASSSIQSLEAEGIQLSKKRSSAPDIPNFTYVGHLGGGGFADVYRYRDALDRDVAVKILRKGMTDKRFLKFEQEAALMARLSSHPNIVTIYQFGMSEDERPFLVMEMYPGGSLTSEIQEQPYSFEKALKVGVQIAGAIETAHRMGVLHRDIKPSNILFNRLGHPALTDFGISVSLEAEGKAGGGMSPQWAPPEQFKETANGGKVGTWSDVYALAATLWAAMEGHSPMWLAGKPNDLNHLRERAQTMDVPKFEHADVPQDFERVLRIAMSKDPRDRYQTALDFARALQKVQAAHNLPITPVEVLSKDGEVKGVDSGLSDFAQAQARSSASGSGADGQGGASIAGAPSAQEASQMRRMRMGMGQAGGAYGVSHIAAGYQGAQAAYGMQGNFAMAGVGAGMLPKKRRTGLIAGIIAAIAALVIVVGVVVFSLVSGGKETGTVPQVTDLTGVTEGDTVLFTWGNPAKEEGDKYHYSIENSGGGDSEGEVAEEVATVKKGAGKTCISVQLVRADGSKSAAKSACAD